MFYFVKTPWWLKKLYGRCIWDMPGKEKVLYLTFDDGPHPEITPFVLDELRKYNAKATFFCIGNNVAKYPGTYRAIIAEGHAVANHTFDHISGWKTPAGIYMDNIGKAAVLIKSELFRPPYGKITRQQVKLLSSLKPPMQVVMWDILSGDFDTGITPETCFSNVQRSREGSIVVFHDSEKAYKRMSYALPKLLQYFSERGFSFKSITV